MRPNTAQSPARDPVPGGAVRGCVNRTDLQPPGSSGSDRCAGLLQNPDPFPQRTTPPVTRKPRHLASCRRHHASAARVPFAKSILILHRLLFKRCRLMSRCCSPPNAPRGNVFYCWQHRHPLSPALLHNPAENYKAQTKGGLWRLKPRAHPPNLSACVAGCVVCPTPPEWRGRNSRNLLASWLVALRRRPPPL